MESGFKITAGKWPQRKIQLKKHRTRRKTGYWAVGWRPPCPAGHDWPIMAESHQRTCLITTVSEDPIVERCTKSILKHLATAQRCHENDTGPGYSMHMCSSLFGRHPRVKETISLWMFQMEEPRTHYSELNRVVLWFPFLISYTRDHWFCWSSLPPEGLCWNYQYKKIIWSDSHAWTALRVLLPVNVSTCDYGIYLESWDSIF